MCDKLFNLRWCVIYCLVPPNITMHVECLLFDKQQHPTLTFLQRRCEWCVSFTFPSSQIPLESGIKLKKQKNRHSALSRAQRDDSLDEYRQSRAIPQKRQQQKQCDHVEDEGQVRVGKAQRKRKAKVKKGPTEEDLLNLPPEEGALSLPHVIFDIYRLMRYLDG